jgi:hypothetical protein
MAFIFLRVPNKGDRRYDFDRICALEDRYCHLCVCNRDQIILMHVLSVVA